MADEFDPYRAWLGLECGTRRPDYYQLLGISRREADIRLIIAAGDRAMAKVRAHRPGRNAAAWARLLDEIASAKQCLTDAAERHRYDLQLSTDAAESGNRELSSPNSAEDPNFFPPGYSKHVARRDAHETAEEPHVADAPAESVDDGCPADQSPEETIAAVDEAATNRGHADELNRELLASLEAQRTNGETGGAIGRSQSDWAASAGSPRADRAEHVVRRRPISPLLLGVAMGFGLLLVAAIVAFFGRRSEQPPPGPANPLAGRPDVAEPPRRDEQQPNNLPTPVSGLAGRELKKEPGGADETRSAAADEVEPARPEPPSRATGEPPNDPVASTPPASVPEQAEPAEAMPDDPTGMGPMPGYAAPPAAGMSDDEFDKELRRAREAVGEFNFALANQAISLAQSSAGEDHRRERVAAVQTLIEHVRVFAEAVSRAASTLPAASEISLGEESRAIIVETGRDFIVVRAEGKNRRFRHEEMPLGLEVALGVEALGQDEAASRIYKAAYVLVSPKAGAEDKQRAIGWLQQAQAGAPAARKILTAVDAAP